MSDLTEIAKRPLRKLDWRQRNIVLAGLRNKLWHQARTGHLSYRYDVCPVCIDMGSTEKNPRCQNCYIEAPCQLPFWEGFKEDQERGTQYFQDMYNFLVSEEVSPGILVVGGNWNRKGGRPSKIVERLAYYIWADEANGGNIRDLERLDITPYRLVVWMPNVPNEESKHYPRKARGAVLVVSKVMRPGITSADAAARIFKMRANAVIEISSMSGTLQFRLADALSNTWADSSEIEVMGDALFELNAWTRESVRVRSVHVTNATTSDTPADLVVLLELVRSVAARVENEVGGRYFGNVSTRCMKQFPSLLISSSQESVWAWVSPRNTDKQRLTPDDMVLVYQSKPGVNVGYFGKQKPSVDTAVQMELYRQLAPLQYMIHGHAYIEGAPTTAEYFPCGDLREVGGVAECVRPGETTVALNLKNHGFLLAAATLEGMKELVKTSVFVNRL